MHALPGATFSEEKREAALSQLQQAKQDDPMFVTIQDHEKQYRLGNMKHNEPKELIDPHVRRTVPAWVVIPAQRLINAIQNGTLPVMPLPPGATTTKGVPPAEWPADYAFPNRAWNNCDDTEVKIVGVKMVRNLLSHIVIKDGTPQAQVIHDSQEVLGTKPSGEANRMRDSMQHLLNRIDTKLTQLTRQRPKLAAKTKPKPGPQSVPEPKPRAAVHNLVPVRPTALAKRRAKDPLDAPIPQATSCNLSDKEASDNAHGLHKKCSSVQ